MKFEDGQVFEFVLFYNLFFKDSAVLHNQEGAVMEYLIDFI